MGSTAETASGTAFITLIRFPVVVGFLRDLQARINWMPNTHLVELAYFAGFDGYKTEKIHYYHSLETSKRNNFHKKNANDFHNVSLEYKIIKECTEKKILIHIRDIFTD